MENMHKETELPLSKMAFKYFPFFNRKQPVFVLILLGIVFYGVSVFNEYALDDGIIIHQNEYVLKGVKGAGDLLTKDMYDSFYRRMNASDQLEGGRYRPLTTISFAIEQEVIGTYRSGFYNRADDLNHNGKLDDEPVEYVIGKNKYRNYEYNNFIDLNKDNVAQPNECYPCWDKNKNFHNDTQEDVNQDGVINEVDCQVDGAWFRHFNNIWLYILCSLLVYVLCGDYFFKSNPDMAFLAALIFLIHPVHSEVVANIKGRDELLSVIFICLTFIFSFRFIETKKISALMFSVVTMFLALMSKEYGLLLPVLIPAGLYVFTGMKVRPGIFISIAGFILFGLLIIFLKDTLPCTVLIIVPPLLFASILFLIFRKSFKEKNEVLLMTSLLSITLFYLGIRISAVGLTPGVPDTELLNNPYLLASGEQQFASKVEVLLRYLGLVIFPKTLVSDYSYASIPYSSFTSPGFIFSVLLNIALLVTGTWLLIKRHVLGFGIITYYVFLIPVCNFFFASSTVMLETYLFHPSIGFSIVFAWLIVRSFDKLHNVPYKRTLMISVLFFVIVLFGIEVNERCRDWKNDVTLFLEDVNKSPNSVLVLGNAGARWIDLADTKEITGVALPGEDPRRMNDYNGKLHITDEEVIAGGFHNKREAALNKGIGYLKKAVELHPRYVNGFLNLGLAYFKLDDDLKAIYYWKIAEHLYPENPYLQNYYLVYYNLLTNRGTEAFSKGNYQSALEEYTKCTIVDPFNAKGWYNLGGAYYNLKDYNKARECWEKALKLKPDYEDAKKALQAKA